ncbi:glycosyltransferase [Siccirubricoccus deserti]
MRWAPTATGGNVASSNLERMMEIAAQLLVGCWLAASLLATLGCAWTLHLLGRRQPQPMAEPPVLVVVPVRGRTGLANFLAGLAMQDWPAWHVAFAVEAEDDPAWAMLGAALPGRSTVVVAGAAERRSQKLHQLLAALPALRPEDAALVTLDADTVPPPGLLRALLRPVLTGQGDIASGYRWTLAAPGAGVAARWLALIDSAIATLPRCARCNLCWGGATAISRAALARLDLPRLWDRAVSDDLVLTRAARALGLVIYAPLDVRPPSAVAPGLAEALAFGIRQYRLLRLHAPRTWALAGAVMLPPLAGGVAALLTGNVVALAAALLLQAGRVWLRAVSPRGCCRGMPRCRTAVGGPGWHRARCC